MIVSQCSQNVLLSLLAVHVDDDVLVSAARRCRAGNLRRVYPSKLFVGVIYDIFHNKRHDLRRMVNVGVDVYAMRNGVGSVSAQVVEKVNGTAGGSLVQNILNNFRSGTIGVILTERIAFVACRPLLY